MFSGGGRSPRSLNSLACQPACLPVLLARSRATTHHSRRRALPPPAALLEAPSAPRRPHTLESHGDVRVDEYYWLRCVGGGGRVQCVLCVSAGLDWARARARMRAGHAPSSPPPHTPRCWSCRPPTHAPTHAWACRDDARESPDVITYLEASGQLLLALPACLAGAAAAAAREGRCCCTPRWPTPPTHPAHTPHACRLRTRTPRLFWGTPRLHRKLCTWR